jgi:ketosteroid isomerase-like protein
MSESMPTNTDLVRRLFDEVFNARDTDVLDELVADDYTEHALAPFESDEPGAVDGPAHMRRGAVPGPAHGRRGGRQRRRPDRRQSGV